ncbi:hypothetical protein [Chitinophaga nivalis]|uniref:DUF695 domain-containing protein n=1 Tax=Chitinophaga nivalis TaxID=2991709 RepID=A0ABT3IRN1_9BACT|nr:hypothetical protein [Chitinophaga nivalis]MCW3463669.1 hypothetical protein [Chitinophaga nivalis]MCW3486641.1 hypothetical protein [Chitinophaga nivalis]
MNLQFTIQTCGYITAEFEMTDRKIKIGHSSTYGDKFQELLNGLFIIYNSSKEGDSDFFSYTFEVKWYDDRVNYSWILTSTALGSEIEIKIHELSPVDPCYNVELLKSHISFKDLFNAIYLSLNRMLKDFGFIGYKNNWDVGDFPVYEYLKLKSDKYNLKLYKEDGIESDDWKSKISIEDEMNLVLLDQ